MNIDRLTFTLTEKQKQKFREWSKDHPKDAIYTFRFVTYPAGTSVYVDIAVYDNIEGRTLDLNEE